MNERRSKDKEKRRKIERKIWIRNGRNKDWTKKRNNEILFRNSKDNASFLENYNIELLIKLVWKINNKKEKTNPFSKKIVG